MSLFCGVLVEATASPPTSDVDIRIEASPEPMLDDPIPASSHDERWETDDSLPPHAIVVVHHTLRARLDPSTHVIDGEGEIRWENRSTRPVQELFVHTYLNAFKNERSEFLRAHLGAGRGNSLPSDWGFIDVRSFVLKRDSGDVELWSTADRFSPGDEEDQTDIRVPLPSPVAPGETIELSVRFQSKLPSIVERTGYLGTFHFAGQWFPKIARLRDDGSWEHFTFHRLSEFSADFGSYDVTLDVPNGFTVGATAAKTGERREGGRTISTWHQDDVHDFAWTAWDQFEEQNRTINGVEVRALYPKGLTDNIERQFDAVKLGFDCYGRRFGRYPYSHLTVVHPPRGANEAGGMEYPTLITTGGPWWMPRGVLVPESLALHELGHQHFYGLVATNEHDWPFLDEGLNSYAEEACLHEKFGDASGAGIAGLNVGLDAVQRMQALGVGQDTPIAQPASSFPTGAHYGGLVYMRTATLMRTLGAAFGRDLVDRALARYTRAHRFRHPTPRDLLSELRNAGGPELARAAYSGLFERGWVDFAVTDFSSTKQSLPAGIFDRPSGRETVATGAHTGAFAGWATVVRRGTLRMPVDIDLIFEGGRRERTHWRGQSDWARVEYSGPEQLVGIEVDPDGKIEIDERRDNNGKQLAPTGAWRVFDHVAYSTSLLAFIFSP
ncbi:MAG: M1 family metallopeptidase [Polyangiaceae bacterium]